MESLPTTLPRRSTLFRL